MSQRCPGEKEKKKLTHCWTGVKVMDALSVEGRRHSGQERCPQKASYSFQGKKLVFGFTKMYAQKMSEDVDHN